MDFHVDALAKFAFNDADASKVLGIAKLKQVSTRALPKPMSQVGLQIIPPRQSLTNPSPKLKALSDEQTKSFPPNMVAALEKAKPSYDDTSKKMPQGGIASPGGQTTAHQFGDLAGIKIPPNQRKMFEAVSKGHELDELQALKNPQESFARRGHMSPEVILKEHNRLVTLPPGNDELKKVMQTVRGAMGESGQLAEAGVTYGQGPRYSRHARKRITENMEQKYKDMQQRVNSVIEDQRSRPRAPPTVTSEEVAFDQLPDDVKAMMRRAGPVAP